MKASAVLLELQSMGDREKAKGVARFFKCGKGEYGEGDFFLGVNVPSQRKLAKKYSTLLLSEIRKLLDSKYHEARLTGLLILVALFETAGEKEQKKIYTFYMSARKRINNWDLVDVTTPTIVGGYLLEHPSKRSILYRLMKSKNIWERRIAILATFAFLRKNDFVDTLRIAESLLADTHDLIHKATGWMLREVGKRDRAVLKNFLDTHRAHMPRTMLRYAIEHFPEIQRKKYLKT